MQFWVHIMGHVFCTASLERKEREWTFLFIILSFLFWKKHSSWSGHKYREKCHQAICMSSPGSEKNNTIMCVGVGQHQFVLLQYKIMCYKNVFVNISFSSTLLRFRLARLGGCVWSVKKSRLQWKTPDRWTKWFGTTCSSSSLLCWGHLIVNTMLMFHVWTNALRFDIFDMFTTNLQDCTHGQHIFCSYTYDHQFKPALVTKTLREDTGGFWVQRRRRNSSGSNSLFFLCSSASSKWTLLYWLKRRWCLKTAVRATLHVVYSFKEKTVVN